MEQLKVNDDASVYTGNQHLNAR